MKAHEYAELFPMATDQEISDMADDIKQRGLLNSIITLDGKILDGRNRFAACKKAGVEPKTKEYTGKDALSDVVSWNLHRRHMTVGQKAALAVELKPKYEEMAKERMQAGKKLNPVESLPQGKSRDQAGMAVGVSGRTVADAEKIRDVSPSMFQEIKSGKLTIHDARKQIRKHESIKREKAALLNLSEKAHWVITDKQTIVQCSALITDPPYGILDEPWEPKKLESFTREWLGRWRRCGADIIISFWSQRHLFDGRKWFDEELTGYTFQQLLVWHYPNNKSPQSRMMFKQTWEPIFFYRKNGSTRSIRCAGSEWGEGLNDFDAHVAAVPQSNFNDADMKQHPAQKPVSVMRWLVNATTEPGDLIADPFSGSGTTGIASVSLKRRFHGIETDEKFKQLSRERIAAYGNV